MSEITVRQWLVTHFEPPTQDLPLPEFLLELLEGLVSIDGATLEPASVKLINLLTRDTARQLRKQITSPTVALAIRNGRP
jgi:hypothetical protein